MGLSHNAGHCSQLGDDFETTLKNPGAALSINPNVGGILLGKLVTK